MTIMEAINTGTTTGRILPELCRMPTMITKWKIFKAVNKEANTVYIIMIPMDISSIKTKRTIKGTNIVSFMTQVTTTTKIMSMIMIVIQTTIRVINSG